MAQYFGQLVIGPAGSGKSTYCMAIQEMASVLKRNILVINLDPAAENFKYRCDIDIRDLITLEDVMEEMHLGPNGGLVYCMEYLILNIEWLQEELNSIATDDYVLIDCPGQIELYTHLDLIPRVTRMLTSMGFALSTVYMLDINFLSDDAKFLSGLLMALSASMTMDLPHFTILSKCDLVPDKQKIKRFLKLSKFTQECEYAEELDMDNFSKTYENFTKCTFHLIETFGTLKLLAMDLSEEDTVQTVLQEIDYAIGWGENVEPDDKTFDQVEENIMKHQFQQIDLQ